jgi:uncharacterized RDD family membrane protein YckC
MNIFRPKTLTLFPNGTNIANFFIRSMAYFIDIFVVFTIRYIVWIAFSALWFYDAMENFYYQFQDTFSYTLSKPVQQFEYYEMFVYSVSHSFFIDFAFVVIFIFLIGAVYYIYMHYAFQQTLGKKLLRLKLLDNKTDKEGMFVFVALVLWYDPLMLGRDRRSMHDFIAFTKVIKLRPNKS